ncbi:MAG: glycosyltransferase family 4 protein [Planctomycetota bacterium]
MGLRIGILTEKYAPDAGGLAVSSERLASMLGRAGHEVFVMTPSPKLPAGDAAHETRDRVTVTRFGVHKSQGETLLEWNDLAVATRKKQGLDIFHALSASWSSWAAVHAARWCGIPAVVSTRGADLDSSITDPARTSIVLWALEKAEAVTAPSVEIGKKVHTLAGDRAVYLQPPSVDAGIFRRLQDAAEVKAKLGLAGSKVIGFAGEAKKRKGLVTLLKTLGRLLEEDKSWKLLLAGALKRDDAHLVAGWQKAHPSTSKAVGLIPWKTAGELARVMNAMDVLALPAWRTAGPASVVEAMACETPVVVSDVPGLRGIVRNNQTGIVVPQRDDVALADAIRKIVTDGEHRQKLTTAGRAWALSEASPEKEREALEHAYGRAMGKGDQGKTVRFQVIPGQR